MTPETKNRIDLMSIFELLEAQRYAPIGDPRFQGEEGKYRTTKLTELRDRDNVAYVRASKDLG